MNNIDILLHIVSFMNDVKTIMSISLINKFIYNTTRKPYYKKMIVESFIGNKYKKGVEHCLSLSFIDMMKVINRLNPNILLIAYTNVESGRIDWNDMDRKGNNIIVCDNIMDLIGGLPKVMNVGIMDDSGDKEYTLIIGELRIHNKEASEVIELVRYKILQDEIEYDNIMDCHISKNNYDNVLIYWVYSGWYGHRIEFLYKDSVYYNNWSFYNYAPYDGVPDILNKQKLTINEIITDNGNINDDVKILNLDIKIMNYLLCNMRK